MSRKDFAAFASIVADMATEEGQSMAARYAKKMADIFAAANPRFDRRRFYAACKLDGY